MSRSVCVPASTSNLGPGFDFLGLALSLKLEVSCRPIAGREHRFERLEGQAEGWPAEDNLLLRAFDRGLAAFGHAPSSQAFEVRSEIPVGRGLGSSGAAVAAGLLLAAERSEQDVELFRLCELGLELEGHPDNSTASLVGGCTLAVPLDEGRLRVIRQPLHETLGMVVAWPAAPLSTSRARAALPSQVPFADAVENPRRFALLCEGLRSADPELLRLGSHERLHVACRLPLIPGAEAAIRQAEEAGAWIATLSGAGSGVFAIGPKGQLELIREALLDGFAKGAPGAEGRIVEPVFGTPRVE